MSTGYDPRQAHADARQVLGLLGIDPTDEPKRLRNRLAKAELLMVLAGAATRLSDYSSHTLRIAETYGLTETEVDRICDAIGGELETRAMNAGYDQTWRS